MRHVLARRGEIHEHRGHDEHDRRYGYFVRRRAVHSASRFLGFMRQLL